MPLIILWIVRSMLFKTTTRLFKGIYQYKIVLVCSGASLFRGTDLNSVLDNLNKIDFSEKKSNWKISHFKTQDDLDYAFKLQNALSKMTGIDIRVESPWMSIYTNNKKDITVLSKIDPSKVKYACVPPNNTTLDSDTVIMPKMNYDYRVTLGKTNQEYSAFISWADTNKKCKLTKSCISALKRNRSWGGTHFYITGDNNLLMAKMHLGGSIAKVERIVKN